MLLLKRSLFLLCLLIPGTVIGQEATIENIIVTNTRDDLLLYFSVKNAFHDELKKAVLNGVSASFSYHISLQKIKNFWFDKELADFEMTRTLKYNALKKEFTVKRSEKPNDHQVTLSFEEAQKLTVEVDSAKVIPLDLIQKGGHYRISLKAELDKVRLPFYLHYVFFFVSLWDVETDWYTIDFTY